MSYALLCLRMVSGVLVCSVQILMFSILPYAFPYFLVVLYVCFGVLFCFVYFAMVLYGFQCFPIIFFIFHIISNMVLSLSILSFYSACLPIVF